MAYTSDSKQSVLVLDNITIRVRDKFFFNGTNWEIKKDQHWAVIGPNGAGKTTLAAAIAGERAIVAGKISYPHFTSPRDQISYVSFESHQQLIANEEALDAARYFSKKLNSFTTARDAILSTSSKRQDGHPQGFKKVLALLQIEELLNRPIRFLSTGQIRKVLIASALAKSPKLLILDEPFEGLDVQSRTCLSVILHELMKQGTQVILVTHRLAEVVPDITHVLGVKDGQILIQGKREEILVDEKLKELYAPAPINFSTVPRVTDDQENPRQNQKKILVAMKGVKVRYGQTLVLDNLSWTLKSGENWAITGPNGAGKTTLLSLIAGDNPQAYSNEIFLFGNPRGAGESIWEIKQKIGFISSEFQIRYRKSITTRDVVLSGFFDSVGLYRHSSPVQREVARQWMALLRIGDQAEKSFNTLSYGKQRLALLARAMIKSPRLLILDEPCQGLDRPTRKVMLALIDFIGCRTTTNILYVTHHQEEWPACITHILRFKETKAGKYKAIQETARS
ncbi:MAG: ATP-binding cassette domain-containing protein [Deltaproteobacteria bacterium]|nr:MAG: ATP-binding cassette domain-containing protein [Deltaproteobacteria bacterium]